MTNSLIVRVAETANKLLKTMSQKIILQQQGRVIIPVDELNTHEGLLRGGYLQANCRANETMWETTTVFRGRGVETKESSGS